MLDNAPTVRRRRLCAVPSLARPPERSVSRSFAFTGHVVVVVVCRIARYVIRAFYVGHVKRSNVKRVVAPN